MHIYYSSIWYIWYLHFYHQLEKLSAKDHSCPLMNMKEATKRTSSQEFVIIFWGAFLCLHQIAAVDHRK